jgi:hypothetical protein
MNEMKNRILVLLKAEQDYHSNHSGESGKGKDFENGFISAIKHVRALISKIKKEENNFTNQDFSLSP